MKEKRPIGVTLVGCLNVFFGLVAFLLAIVALVSSISLTIGLAVKGLVLVVSGVGLLRLNFWAWLLALAVCVISIVEFALYPTLAFPLELIVLPYLVSKIKTFRGDVHENKARV